MLLNNDFTLVLKLVPDLTHDDMFMELKKPTSRVFIEVPVTEDNFRSAEDSYYNITIGREFISENGWYIIQGTAGTSVATASTLYSTKATAFRTGVEFEAVTPGVIGNNIALFFDGVDTVATVVSAWNMNPANVNNQVTFTGTGSTVLTLTTVSLIGGTDNNLVTFEAEKSGPIGNTIHLVFDGIQTTGLVCSTWNAANPDNLVKYDEGANGYVPNSVIDLFGGTEISYEAQNEAFPWGSALPNTCTIYGNVTDVGGMVQPYTIVDVFIWPLRLPSVTSNTMLLGQKLTTRADTKGYFEVIAVVGATVVIEVPAAGFRLQLVVPDQGSVPLADLIPVVTPSGASVKM